MFWIAQQLTIEPSLSVFGAGCLFGCAERKARLQEDETDGRATARILAGHSMLCPTESTAVSALPGLTGARYGLGTIRLRMLLARGEEEREQAEQQNCGFEVNGDVVKAVEFGAAGVGSWRGID